MTSKRLPGRNSKFTLLPSITSVAALLFGMTACSGGKDDPEHSTLTASQVCDSTLDSTASAALNRLGATTAFVELAGTRNSGESSTFSLEDAARTLHEDRSRRNQCVVFKAGNTSGHPLIDVDFSAESNSPDVNSADSGDTSTEAYYPIGVYAKSHGNISGKLYFECATQDTGKSKESTPYIRASLTTAPGQISVKGTGRDLMTVLNAISRALANELGCTSEAGLPAKVPEAEAD